MPLLLFLIPYSLFLIPCSLISDNWVTGIKATHPTVDELEKSVRGFGNKSMNHAINGEFTDNAKQYDLAVSGERGMLKSPAMQVDTFNLMGFSY
ncbi:MAG TPA: hypothetical protein EYH12_00695 [Psychromonas hadalis]|nr:hypothetical protein [Psychromonas hadalis]